MVHQPSAISDRFYSLKYHKKLISVGILMCRVGEAFIRVCAVVHHTSGRGFIIIKRISNDLKYSR